MYLCYIDESGTPDIPGNTSHFVLAGLSIPISRWRYCDRSIEAIKSRYGLRGVEIHVAWLLRRYREQRLVENFADLGYQQRRYEVGKQRKIELLRLQRSKNPKQYKQTRKNFAKSDDYIHLSYEERFSLVRDVARCVSEWGFARLFAECVDKVHFDPARARRSVDEQAFEQVVSRFEQYLEITKVGEQQNFGLLIHDNNQTVARKHTAMMRNFLRQGTLWTNINNIVETPLFVDSQLTSMIQIADLCSYALRRYLENGEEELLDLIFKRADRKKDGVVVGVRHFTSRSCSCKICQAHNRPPLVPHTHTSYNE